MPAPEAVVVNQCRGLEEGGGGLLSTPERLVVLHLKGQARGVTVDG